MSHECDYCDYQTESKRGLKWHTSNSHKNGVGHVFKDTQRGCVGDLYEHINVRTSEGKHMVAVHRLVAYAHGILDFEGLCDPNTIVHHKSRHGLDNRPENLEVMSRSDHQKHHKRTDSDKLDWSTVFELREIYENTDITQKQLASKYGISHSMAQKITQNRRWQIEDAPDVVAQSFEVVE